MCKLDIKIGVNFIFLPNKITELARQVISNPPKAMETYLYFIIELKYHKKLDYTNQLKEQIRKNKVLLYEYDPKRIISRLN